MTETALPPSMTVPNPIHTGERLEDGWRFVWGEGAMPCFELICRTEDEACLERLRQRLDAAYVQALHTLSPAS